MSGLKDFRAKYPQYDDVPDQDLADRLYAKHYSDMPRGVYDRKMGLEPASDPVADGATQLVRGVNRGLNSMIALPGNIIGGAVEMAGFPETGKSMQWNNAKWNKPFTEFMRRPDDQPKTTLGRYANATGQAIGASAVPTGALVGGASRLAAMAPTTTLRAVAQDVGRRVAVAPGVAVAADAVAATGGASGAQAARDAGAGPVTQTVAGIAGAMVPSVAIGGLSRVAQPLRRAAAEQGRSGAYGNVANSIEGGPDALARSVALGGGSGGAAGANRQAVLRILGEEMVTANGNAAQARAATISRISRETGVTPETAANQFRSLQSAQKNNPLMLGEQPSISASDDALRGSRGGLKRPHNVDVESLKNVNDSAARGKFDYLASSGNAPSAVQTRNALATRQDTLADNLRGTLSRMQQQADSRGRSLNIQDSENLIQSAVTAGNRAYEVTYNGPINNQVMLETLPKVLARFERNAAMRAGDVGEAMQNAARQFYSNTPDGPVAMMSLRQLQDARTRLRELRNGYAEAGAKSLARPLNQLYGQITALMSRMSPQWAKANREWADLELDRVGARLGDSFSKTPGPNYRKQLREFTQLNPQAQDIVRIHYVQKLLDLLDNAKDTHSIGKMFTSDHNRNAIRTILGDQAAVDFTRAVRNITTAEKTFSMNSRTHIRGEVKGQEEIYTNLESAKRSWSVGAMRDLLLEKVGQVLTERRNKPLADIITTPVSNTPQTAMHIERMRQQQKRLRAIAAMKPKQIPASGMAAPTLYDE